MILSIICNIVFNKLLENNIIVTIEKILDSIAMIQQSDILELTIVNNDFLIKQFDESNNLILFL